MLDSLGESLIVFVNVIIVAAITWGFLVSKWRTIQGGRELWNDLWSPDRKAARWAVALSTIRALALLAWIVFRQRSLS